MLCCTGCSRFSRYYSSDMSTPASQPLLKKKWKQNGWNDWMWLYGGSLGSHVLYHGLQVILDMILNPWCFFYMEEDVKVGFYSPADPILLMLFCVLKCVGVHRCNTQLMLESKGSYNFSLLLFLFLSQKWLFHCTKMTVTSRSIMVNIFCIHKICCHGP